MKFFKTRREQERRNMSKRRRIKKSRKTRGEQERRNKSRKKSMRRRKVGEEKQN